MYRTAVESSNVAAVGYDPNRRILEIEFLSGSIYHYRNVPQQVHQDLMAAESKGRFLNSIIKGQYPSNLVKASERLAAVQTHRRPVSAMQEMYLEMIRASSREQLDGPLVVDSLLAHRDLWESVAIGSSFGLGLVLRDLSDGHNNVDTLYILTEAGDAATELVKLAYQEWDADEVHFQTVIDKDERLYDANVNMCLGGSRRVIAVWWD